VDKEQQIIQMSEKLFPATKHSYDILVDLFEIIVGRLSLFEENIDQFEKNRAEEYLSEMKKVILFSLKPECEYLYRLYIISGIQFVSLCCVDLSEKNINRIIGDLEMEFSLCDEFPIDSLEPNAVSTLYIFKNREIILYEHMFPSHLAFIINELTSKNIVNYNLKWLS